MYIFQMFLLMIAMSPDNWKKTFSLCDHDGYRLLVLETTLDRTNLIAGTISGIAFELFRSHGNSFMDYTNRR